MPRIVTDRRTGRITAANKRDRDLLARAARRAGLAGAALTGAAGDLDNAHSRHGESLEGLAEMIRDEAGRVAELVADIEQHSRRLTAVEL